MKKVLFVSDSPVLNTGFGKVLRKIAVHMSRQYEVKVLGWFHTQSVVGRSVFPFDIVPTHPGGDDTYGEKTFPALVQAYKPDLVFCLGDSWMVKSMTEYPNRKFHLMLYCPVDGAPLPPGWVNVYSKANTFVAYLPWAKKVIEASGTKFPVHVIPHGIDTSVYRPHATGGESPFPDNQFLVGCVARNQPRKQLPRLLKTYSAFLSQWTFCPGCGTNHLGQKLEKCPHCNSTSLVYGDSKTDSLLYMHASNEDVGWNLQALAERYNMKDFLIMPPNMEVGGGISETELSDLYMHMDVFTLPTSGEGFGIPIMEAMACGVPTLVTNYSAHVDFCRDASDLINVSEFVTEPGSCVERALVDMTDYYMRLERMYYEHNVFWPKWGRYMMANFGVKDRDGKDVLCGVAYRKHLSEAGLKRVKEYTWEKIMPKWDELFASILGKPEEKKGLQLEIV
jgi:glycosyltransferase involved in cell wall biosynthesis